MVPITTTSAKQIAEKFHTELICFFITSFLTTVEGLARGTRLIVIISRNEETEIESNPHLLLRWVILM